MKKRNKVSADFNMSSLTDIIFLLLIFFMLTSSLVQYDAVDLPESDAQTTAPTNIAVMLPKEGDMTLNGSPITMRKLKSAVAVLKREAQRDKIEPTIMIVADSSTPVEKTAEVMGIASALKMKAILATKPKNQ